MPLQYLQNVCGEREIRGMSEVNFYHQDICEPSQNPKLEKFVLWIQVNHTGQIS